ncbi:hypothetical protein HZB94_01180 [Candidatus Falkowbacteria bacterium]|nr:hypothetical protein [Candidatus Falkowbacteria bacterium]
MKQSQLFAKTSKSVSKDEVSLNAKLLIKAGFVDKLMAGVYTYLPLGLIVLRKIQNIIREEMNAVDGQEILMPALTPKENWIKTGRWDAIDVLFKLEGAGDKEYALGSTHEEIVTPLVKKMVNSYKDLPVAVYQIQDKFRNEPRAKSGLLRGREFSMKDLYSFHADEADLDSYYEKVKAAYLKIFQRMDLNAIVAEASGGTFSKYSHEFQVLTENGEDLIFYCEKCFYGQNKEISEYKAGDKCPRCGAKMLEGKAIEVGNIFKLKTKFSEPFDLSFLDKNGKKKFAVMGCYGIGPSRIMGAIVEIHYDEAGIIWPTAIAPFSVHLLFLGKDDKIKKQCESLYNVLSENGIEVLYDDRDASPGEKLKDSDLLGIPERVIISERTFSDGMAEVKKRGGKEKAKLMKIDEILKKNLENRK